MFGTERNYFSFPRPVATLRDIRADLDQFSAAKFDVIQAEAGAIRRRGGEAALRVGEAVQAAILDGRAGLSRLD
jgi:hypothetical protein